jgi:hypothetical protein
MATLKSLVDETTNIKDELVECHTNLKNNLIAKGVECSDNDKMLSLIDRVEEISTATTVKASDNILLNFGYSTNPQGSSVTIPASSTVKQVNFKSTFNGSVRFLVVFNNGSGNVDGVFFKNDSIVKTVTGGLNMSAMSFDFTNVNVGDVLSFGVKNTFSNDTSTVMLNSMQLKGDIVQ